MGTFTVGTRGSKLALTQTTTAAEALAGHAEQGYELITVKTEGDILTGPLAQMGGTGVFASALRQALFDKTCDVAVHSLKDLPAKDLEGLAIASVPVREDVRDALCSADDVPLEKLPRGAKVGTGSPRRAAQLRVVRPDLQIVDIRGNVGTRLARVRGHEAAAEASPQAPNAARGDLDAVVLAGAGLKRLGLEHHIAQLIPPEVMLPAPGQGALAVEVRAEDAHPAAPLGMALALYDDIPARLETSAERGLLARLNAGCSAPIGGLARYDDNPDGGATLRLDSVICAPDGTQVQRAGAEISIEAGADRVVSVQRAVQLGTMVADQLLAEDFGLLQHVVDS